MIFRPNDYHKVYGNYLIWFREKRTYEINYNFKAKIEPMEYCIVFLYY